MGKGRELDEVGRGRCGLSFSVCFHDLEGVGLVGERQTCWIVQICWVYIQHSELSNNSQCLGGLFRYICHRGQTGLAIRLRKSNRTASKGEEEGNVCEDQCATDQYLMQVIM